MVSLEFYVYGILFYLPSAVLFAFFLSSNLFGNDKNDKKVGGKENWKPEVQIDVKKDVDIRKTIQIGKVGYCKFCEIYLKDDVHVRNHPNGKKHISAIEGRDCEWLEIMEESKMKNNKRVQKPAKFSNEDYEEGFVL